MKEVWTNHVVEACLGLRLGFEVEIRKDAKGTRLLLTKPTRHTKDAFEVAESLIICLDPRLHLAPTRGTDHDHQDHNTTATSASPCIPTKTQEKRVVRRGRPAFYSHPSSHPQGATS